MSGAADMPWRDKELLREEHLEKGKSPYDIADEWGCSPKTIYRWLDKHEVDLDRRRKGNTSPWNVPNDRPWKDKETLKTEYIENGNGCTVLADKWGCSPQTIYDWLNNHEIPIRKSNHDKVPYYHTDRKGHERIQAGFDYTIDYVKIHRLAAVAWFGLDAVVGKDIHHKNDIGWDNRESNLQPMDHAAHSELRRDDLGRFA